MAEASPSYYRRRGIHKNTFLCVRYLFFFEMIISLFPFVISTTLFYLKMKSIKILSVQLLFINIKTSKFSHLVNKWINYHDYDNRYHVMGGNDSHDDDDGVANHYFVPYCGVVGR